MDCCTECFTDEYVRDLIEQRGAPGDCDFCGAQNVATVDSRELRDLFESLLAAYTPVSEALPYVENPWTSGEPLADLIQCDWGIFSDAVSECRQQIIEDMCRMIHPKHDLGIHVDDVFVPYYRCYWYTTPEEYWHRFVRHITRERRYVLLTHGELGISHDVVLDPREWLPTALDLVSCSLLAGSGIWRARIHDDSAKTATPRKAPDAEWLGPPPPEHAAGGRANASGIPVFYGALDAHTAVNEVRPVRDQDIWVAEWHLVSPVTVADLTAVPYVESPFAVSDLRGEIERRAFLGQVSDALAASVAPNQKQIEYVPTQYVAEVIRDAGVDGIIYQSDQAPPGKNIVLFDAKKLSLSDNRHRAVVEAIAFTFSPPLEP